MEFTKAQLKVLINDIKDVIIESVNGTDGYEWSDVVVVDKLEYYVNATYQTKSVGASFNDGGNESNDDGDYIEMSHDNIEIEEVIFYNEETEEEETIFQL